MKRQTRGLVWGGKVMLENMLWEIVESSGSERGIQRNVGQRTGGGPTLHARRRRNMKAKKVQTSKESEKDSAPDWQRINPGKWRGMATATGNANEAKHRNLSNDTRYYSGEKARKKELRKRKKGTCCNSIIRERKKGGELDKSATSGSEPLFVMSSQNLPMEKWSKNWEGRV